MSVHLSLAPLPLLCREKKGLGEDAGAISRSALGEGAWAISPLPHPLLGEEGEGAGGPAFYGTNA